MEEKWRGDTCFPHSPSSWHLFYKSPGTTNRISRLPYSDFPGSVNNWLIIALHALKEGKGCWDATGGREEEEQEFVVDYLRICSNEPRDL